MADRYVFSIHSKTKWGIDLGVSFFTCYCPSESNAIAILDGINLFLPNYAQCSLSKVIREAGNYDIPNNEAVLTDVNVVSYIMTNSANTGLRKTIKVPLPYIVDGNHTETLYKTDLMDLLVENVCDASGEPLNTVVGILDSGKNIVAQGAVPS